MDRKQIYGFTMPETPKEGTVGYLQVHDVGNASLQFIARQHGSPDGKLVIFTFPAAQVKALVDALTPYVQD